MTGDMKLNWISLSTKHGKCNQTAHLRNSSALSAAEISVTVPFGIYKTIRATPGHAERVKTTQRSHAHIDTENDI